MSKPNQCKTAPHEVFIVGEALALAPRLDEVARCFTCRYSEPLHRTDDQHTCRIDPPVIDPRGPRANGGADWRGVWPIVYSDEHCGRYWPREPLHVDDALLTAYRAHREHEAALEALHAATTARRDAKERIPSGRKVITVKKIEGAAR
ncbi:hypothetical protein CBA19CS22_36875 [Caballeronia novacaledonica]|uniref:Uncharacterized protein n=1 Tax=Caballeronia novacaledonica TaxID=1544861 RepID=A0ACB5R499_9BURK|nr:hypothetical protein CBA19CS22_36875 [Caballeronia novacaledonica]